MTMQTSRPTRIAVPKGRLQNNVLAAFEAAGLPVPTRAMLASRRLAFACGKVEWILVKDADVPLYVEMGVASLGVAGRDQLVEQASDVFQPLELPFGRCRMTLIAAPSAPPLADAELIATKYPRYTRAFVERRRLRARAVALAGSVELAPLVGFAPYIVDLVETGATLRENGLVAVETLEEISPHLIVNKAAYRLQPARIREIVGALEGCLAEVAS
jgi:ATP phosphoribosyltransferase